MSICKLPRSQGEDSELLTDKMLPFCGPIFCRATIFSPVKTLGAVRRNRNRRRIAVALAVLSQKLHRGHNNNWIVYGERTRKKRRASLVTGPRLNSNTPADVSVGAPRLVQFVSGRSILVADKIVNGVPG